MAQAARTRKHRFYNELVPTPGAISVAAAGYFLGALAVRSVDETYLLLAWLMAGLLAISLYASRKGKPVNVATVLFAVAMAVSLLAHMYRA